MQCKYLYEHSCIYCLLSIVDTFALSINRLLLLTLSVQNAVGKKKQPKTECDICESLWTYTQSKTV